MGEQSEAAWFHDLTIQVRDALAAGDRDEVNRLRAYTRRRGGDRLGDLLDQVLAARDIQAAMRALGMPMFPIPIGVARPGEILCDFCASPETVAYYPFEEFAIAGPGGEFLSGDRMFVCEHCRRLVDAEDWRGLRDWVGPGASTEGVRILWAGFRKYRTGPAVPLEEGS